MVLKSQGHVGGRGKVCINAVRNVKTVYIFLAFGPKTGEKRQLTMKRTASDEKSNQNVFVTYTWLADVNVSVAKCLCF